MNYQMAGSGTDGAPAFEADGVYNGVPYRVLPDCSIEAMLPGGLVKFRDMDQLIASSDRASGGYSAGSQSSLLPAIDSRSENSLTTPSDYYSILMRAIDAAKQDSSQLRQLIYERARFNLKRDFLFGYANLPLTDVVRHVNAFEAAIARIEENASDEKPQPYVVTTSAAEPQMESEPSFMHVEKERAETSSDDGPVDLPATNIIQILPPEPVPPLYSAPGPRHRSDDPQLARLTEEFARHARSANKFIGIALVAVAFIGTVIITMLWPIQSRKQLPAPTETTATVSPPAPPAQSRPAGNTAPPADVAKPPFPLPSSFGIYALSGGDNLVELQPLPIGVPDARVALSAEITKPSPTIIADNKPTFILFRRDLANSVPQKIMLRIVARVTRDTKFVEGKASTSPVNDSWRIRDVSRELKISPIPGQREMLLAHLDDGVTLSAGRYALVLNRTGYDFEISTGSPALASCLEQFEAANGTMFNQCRAQ